MAEEQTANGRDLGRHFGKVSLSKKACDFASKRNAVFCVFCGAGTKKCENRNNYRKRTNMGVRIRLKSP